MVIENDEQMEAAEDELWALVQVKNPTDCELERIVELADAIIVFDKAKYGFEGED